MAVTSHPTLPVRLVDEILGPTNYPAPRQSFGVAPAGRPNRDGTYLVLAPVIGCQARRSG